jgi:hypothetical protein
MGGRHSEAFPHVLRYRAGPKATQISELLNPVKKQITRINQNLAKATLIKN